LERRDFKRFVEDGVEYCRRQVAESRNRPGTAYRQAARLQGAALGWTGSEESFLCLFAGRRPSSSSSRVSEIPSSKWEMLVSISPALSWCQPALVIVILSYHSYYHLCLLPLLLLILILIVATKRRAVVDLLKLVTSSSINFP